MGKTLQHVVSVDEFLMGTTLLGDYQIQHRGLPIDIQVADCGAGTSVVLLGDLDGAAGAAHEWSHSGDVNCIRIADPAQSLGMSSSDTWYAGSLAQDDLQRVIPLLLGHLLFQLGSRRTIIWGAGAAGFAALRFAAMLPGGSAVVVNPHTALDRAPAPVVHRYAEAIWGRSEKEHDPLRAVPTCLDVTQIYRHPVAANVFCLLEEWCGERYWEPFLDCLHPSNLVVERIVDADELNGGIAIREALDAAMSPWLTHRGVHSWAAWRQSSHAGRWAPEPRGEL